MAQFPNTPSFTGFNTPSRIEADIADLAHEGTIPQGLNGAFYRVQPDPQFPPRLADDIANGVLYLASDESRFMTGAELKLDGGISAM